jgi:1,4-dihydroxy-2-naphthoyl-CoA hydrolase
MAQTTRHIWKRLLTLEEMNDPARVAKTLVNTLGIAYTKIGDNFIEGTMPVDDRTKQPFGILHGGASVVLAETLGSFASKLVAGTDHAVVGIEVSASHLKAVREGSVTGRVTPIRLGKSLHVWEIKIHETGKEEEGLICHSKLSVLVRKTVPK